jgi:hypothetical protein
VFASVAKQIIALLPIVRRPVDVTRTPLTFFSLIHSFLIRYPILAYLIFPFPFPDPIVSTYLSVDILLPLQSLRRTPLYETPLHTFLRASIPTPPPLAPVVISTTSSTTSVPSASSSINPSAQPITSSSSQVPPVSVSTTTVSSSSSQSTSSSTVAVWSPPSGPSSAPYLEGPPLTPGWDIPSLTDHSVDSDDLLDTGDDVDSSTLSSSLD